MNRLDLLYTEATEDNLQDHLVTTFPDSLILKNGETIARVAPRVASLLGFDAADLVNTPVNRLSEGYAVSTVFQTELSRGHFDDLTVTLKGNVGQKVSCRVSGFNLALSSGFSGLAILKVKLDEISALKIQLEASREELDEFVYRTSHDLRGPLATMRGLINLMKMEADTASPMLMQLVDLLDRQAQTLDDRTINLNYLSEAARPKGVDQTLDCQILESFLRSTIEQHLPINAVDFRFVTSRRFIKNVNAQLITSMLNHLLLYLINLPRNPTAVIRFSVAMMTSGVRVTLFSEGFLSNYQLRQAIDHKDPVYTNVILYSDLISFFAAMKTAQRMKAVIKIDFIQDSSQQISTFIPSGVEGAQS
jgi:signal transduction histidine kinase